MFLQSCKNKEESESFPEINLISLDLSEAGIAATMKVPEGVVVKAMKFNVVVGDSAYFEFKESKDIIAAAKIRPCFGIEINKDDMYSISDRRRGIESNTVNKLVEIINESKNFIFYQTKALGKAAYHFAFFTKIGKNGYSIEDSKGQQYSRGQIEVMIRAAKSIDPQIKRKRPN